MSNFVLAYWNQKRTCWSWQDSHVLSLKSFFVFHYTFLEQEWDVDLNLKGKWYIFGRCFSQLFEKNIWKTIWGALLDIKRHSVPFHILNRRTTNVKLCVVVFSIQYLSTKAVSHLKRGMMPMKWFCSFNK